MKNNLGANKLERQFNRTDKFVGLHLDHASNKYLKVKKQLNKDDKYYLIKPQSWKYSQDKKWVIVSPDNNINDKPYFFKTFGTLKLSQYFNSNVMIVKPYFEKDKQEFAELAKGYDDVWFLNWNKEDDNLFKLDNLMVEKN